MFVLKSEYIDQFFPEVQSVHHLPRPERYVERSFDVDLSPGLLRQKL